MESLLLLVVLILDNIGIIIITVMITTNWKVLFRAGPWHKTSFGGYLGKGLQTTFGSYRV